METVKGKKQLKRRGSPVYTSITLQSAGEKIGHSSLLGQKFQELLGEESNCNFDPLQKRCDNESSHRHRGLPLVQQLQQLIGEDPNTNVDPLQRLHDNESSRRLRRLPLAQQLQVLIGEKPNATVDPLQIRHDNEPSHRHQSLPLVRQLQDLIEEEHNGKVDPPQRPHDNDSSRVHKGLPLVQQLQELIGEEPNNNSDPLQRRCDDELSNRYRGLPAVQQFQLLVQEAPLSLIDPSQSLVRKVNKRIVPRGTKAINSLEKSRAAIQEEIMESFDSDNDAQEGMYDQDNPVYRTRRGHNFHDDSDIAEDILEALHSDEGNFDQKTNINEEGTTGFSVKSLPIIWERFQSALQSAPPETKTTFNSRHNSKEPLTGFSACLQRVLQISKRKRAHLEETFRIGQQRNEHSQWLDVLIVGKYLEAHLVTCECEVSKWPEAWNGRIKARIDGEGSLSTINVIFSPKINPELELEVGQVVRIHSPWQEIEIAGNFRKTILCTCFCEMGSLDIFG